MAPGMYTTGETIEAIMENGLHLLSSMALGLTDADGNVLKFSIGSNANLQYISTTFALRDYCWCDFGVGFGDEPSNPASSIHTTADGYCPPNFEHFESGVSLTWYKHSGRSMSWTKLPDSRSKSVSIILDCMAPLIAGTPSLPRETRD